MAGAKRSTSMSALGQFYDAIFAQGKDQSKKYGKPAKGDFVGEDISDGIATGIVEIASTMGASPKVAEEFQAKAVSYWNDKLTGGFGVDLTDAGLFPGVGKATISWPTAARDEYGNTIGSDTKFDVAPAIKISNLNDLIMDPASVADKAADAFLDSWKAAMNARAIAGIGNAVQRAANYAQLRTIGVDSSVAATITHAVVNARVGAEKSKAGLEDIRDSVLSEVFAMYAGVTDERERAELAQYVRNNIFGSTLANVNATATAVGGNFAFNTEDPDPTKPRRGFTDLFVAQKDGERGLKGSKRNILHEYTQDELFGLNPYGGGSPNQGYGKVLKDSLQSAVGTALGDPRVVANPTLRSNLMRLFSSFDDEAQLKSFLSALGDAGANGYRDMSKVVSIGVRKLGSEFASTGHVADAAKMVAAAATVDAVDGTMTLGDWLSYTSYRQKANGWLGTSSATMSMIVFGDAGATKAFVDGVGAINWKNPLRPLAGSTTAEVNGSYFMDYLAETDGAIGLFKEWNGAQWVDRTTRGGAPESEMFAKYFFGYTNADGKNKDKKRIMGWTQLDFVVNPNSSGTQKAAYMFHVFHPYQLATGMINGKTPQHFIWIGSGFGKNLHDPTKWNRLARLGYKISTNEKYKAFLRLTKKIEGVLSIPGRVIKDATQKAAKVVIEKVVMKIAIKLGLEAALRAILGTLTAGVSELIFWLYTIINWITFGLPDKIVKGTVKAIFQFTVALIEWIIVICISIGVLAFSFIGIFFLFLGGTGATLFPPDPGYSPVLTDNAGYYPGLGPPGSYPPPPGTGAYEGLYCPFSLGNGVWCSQGPYGNGSHACAPDAGNPPYQNRYGVDMSGPTYLYAPEDGNITYVEPNEICGGDPNGAYIIFQGSITGTTYVFAHLQLDPIALGTPPIFVKGGTVMGMAAPLESYCPKAQYPNGCACSHHQHIHAYIQGSTDPLPIFNTLCNTTISCSLNCNPDCTGCQ